MKKIIIGAIIFCSMVLASCKTYTARQQVYVDSVRIEVWKNIPKP